jgi:secernin
MCDSVVAVGDETASGTTLFAKNSDRKSLECQPLLQFAEASHSPRSTVRCTHIAIPQVAETYRVLGHSPWWVWGFEHGVNEHAVAIGNHTIFSKEPLEATPGLIGMDLVRLGLERGRSAREALEVIATLVETHGQGGSALAPGAGGYHNSFLLADPGEAWILETSNRRWVARRTRLDAVSNHLSIRSDWEISSRDLESFARRQGWWRDGGRVDAAAAYREPRIPGLVSEGRQARARELLQAGRRHHDVGTLRRLLSDHHHGGPVWHGEGTPQEERFWTLCAHADPVSWTTASLIAPLPADRSAPWPVWVGFATPCTGVFLPVYLDGVLPPALARGGEAPDPESAWWAFKRLQDAASADWSRHTPVLREAWAEFEEEIETERRVAEASARRASEDGDRDAAARIVSDFMARTVEDAMKRAEMLRARLA